MPGREREFVQHLNAMLGQLKAERSPFDDVWRKVARFESDMMNMFDGQLGNNPEIGLRRDPRDLDNTCRQAITVFSSGMLSGVSPASDQWFSLRVSDKSGGADLEKYRPVAQWLEQVEQVFARDFVNKNFYTQQVSSYKHIGLYGMQCMLVGEAPGTGDTYYRDVPVDEIYIAEDYAGSVNTVFREMLITLGQALQTFGKDNLSPALQRVVDQKDVDLSQKITVVHAVVPKAPGYEPLMGRNKLRYASYYFEPGEEHLIREGGFDSLPYIVTRAYTGGRSPYSISPGTVALADVLMLNEIKGLILQSGQMAIAPAMLMPDRGLVGRLNYAPGAINLYRKDGNTTASDFAPLQTTMGKLDVGFQLLEQAQKDVNAAFFVDLFLMIHNRTQAGRGTPTAMEIQQLASEKSFLLAPILINQQQENFNRLFERVFDIKKHEAGAIPPPPEELLNAEIEIEYVSPLVRAQLSTKAEQMTKGVMEIANLANIYPDVLDIIDSETFARKLMEIRGMPQSCIRSSDEVAEIKMAKMQAQQAAQQQAAQQQMLSGAMAGYEGLSKAPEPGSPAEQILRQAGMATPQDEGGVLA